MRKNIKFFVLKLFFLSLIFTSNANSKSPPPGTISSADASKINVLLMLSDGRHWDQERKGSYMNGGRREHACSILFNSGYYTLGAEMVFHNDHVFMSSDSHGFPDDTWEEKISNKDGVNTIREKLKYPQHIWKGFRGITKHKIGDECTLDKSWAYDGQYSSFDIFKNGSYASPREMFKDLDPYKKNRDGEPICVGYWQDQSQIFRIFKVKTKNNKTRLFALSASDQLCELDLNTGKMTPITNILNSNGWHPYSFSCVLRGKTGNNCRINDLVFSSPGVNSPNKYLDLKNGRLRMNGWFTTFKNSGRGFDYRPRKNLIFDFKTYDGKVTDIQETVCPSWQELYDNKWTDAEKKFWNINRVYSPDGMGWGTKRNSNEQEYDHINGGIAHFTRWPGTGHQFSNDGKYLWGTSFVPNKGHMNSFVIKKLKLEDNGCIEKGSWDIVSTPVDLHQAEKPFGSGWAPFTYHPDDWKMWEVNHSSITEHPTDPKTFFFTAGGYARRAIINKNMPIPKDPYRSFVYKVTFNDDYSRIVSSKKVMFKGGWGDLHNPGKNLGFMVEQQSILNMPLLRILGINEDKNEMYLSSIGRGATNVGFSAFVIDTNTLAFKRVFGGTDTSGVNKKDQESVALEAMIPVLSDPSIRDQINFGLGLHSRSGMTSTLYNPNTGQIQWGKPPNWINRHTRDSHFKNWIGDLTTGYATPCSNYSCLKVRIHDKGADQIKKYFEGQINFKENPDPTNYDYHDPLSGTGLLGIPFFNQIWQYPEEYQYPFWGPYLASDYLKHPTLSPRDPNTPCASTYVVYLVPGGGGIPETSIHSFNGKSPQRLYKDENIKSYVFVYGDLPPENTITSTSYDSNLREWRKINAFGSQHRLYIDKLARESGTEKGIYVQGTTQLQGAFQSLMLSIIEDAKKVSFSAPSVINETKDKNSAYQAKLKFVGKQQWQGELISRKLTEDGKIDVNAKPNWEASKLMLDPDNRKLWSEIPGASYQGNYNNFNDSNSLQINTLFELTGNKVADYHSQTAGQQNTQRCKSASGVMDGNSDDVKGLINFIRGTDYFDYDADCDLFEKRENPLADIYHSEMVVVGAPSEAPPSTSKNTDAYFKTLKNYNAFAKANSSRKKVLYVGANNGILHAFDANTGQELWGFVPPLLAGNLPTMINTALNTDQEGGSNAIYGVDGSPVVSNLFIQSPLSVGGAKEWRTILMAPYGRGGAGFSVLDVTVPDRPIHYYSIYNDKLNKKVHVITHRAEISSYDYDSIPSEYDYTKLGQTWSSPRIARIPNSGAGDAVLDDDINVAIMGGGYDDADETTGSNLTIVNLDNFGKINKVIPLNNITNNNITNSAPNTPLVLTPDSVGDGEIYRGALVYLNDLEGKITKFNLTNMEKDGNGNSIEMYDSTQIFSVDANDKNLRYMYHGMDATIGDKTNNLWLFTGTGDYKRINARDNSENLLLGVKDRYFPNFQKVQTNNRSDLLKCANASNFHSDSYCRYKPEDEGWYITLPKHLKVSAEPTVFDGRVYFPTYQPGGCGPGKATICPVNDECGSNNLYDLRKANNFLNDGIDHNLKHKCMYIGEGVLSKIIVTSSKLYANIAGETTEEGEDLVVLEFPPSDMKILRKSWRENF
ncbi:PilC/PilY family type IV pilus protein [Candidatus Pelagibacter sp.]|nr:PilC/PilY family type IV pilus protein [Candidatus Pelagibacter sp.]